MKKFIIGGIVALFLVVLLVEGVRSCSSKHTFNKTEKQIKDAVEEEDFATAHKLLEKQYKKSKNSGEWDDREYYGYLLEYVYKEEIKYCLVNQPKQAMTQIPIYLSDIPRGDWYIDNCHDRICAYIVEQAVNLDMPALARKTLTLFRQQKEAYTGAQTYYEMHADSDDLADTDEN